MDPRLLRLIKEFQGAVQFAVDLMALSGIARPSSNIEWALTRIPTRGTLLSGIEYHKHGYGCAVELESGSIDFDFGDRGEIDGFDWWRLWQFARERTSQYDFASRTEIESAFAAAAKLGQVVRRGSLYYLAE